MGEANRKKMGAMFPPESFPVWNAICWDDQGRTSAAALMRLFGYSRKRELQAQIAQERRRGCIIVGDKNGENGGYYRSADRSVLAKALESYERLAAIEHAKAETIRRILNLPDGQQGLDDCGDDEVNEETRLLCMGK